MRNIFVVFLPLALCAAGPATGVRGVVVDPSSRPVQGARVECGGRAALTDSGGWFEFRGQPACDAAVTRSGFEGAKARLAPDSPNKIQLAIAGLSETVVVTAARVQTTPEEAGVSASVVGAAELRALDFPAVPEVLRDIPGLQVSSYGGRGELTQVYTRGAQRTGTLVLLDGVPLNDPGGEMNLAHLSTAAIDRVEVIRGPESALFGAEASAGVVQLFTRRGDSENAVPHGSLSYERGNFGTDRWIASLTGGYGGRLDYSFAADQLHTAGAFANNYYRDNTGTANVGYRIAPSTQARGIFNMYYAHTGTPGQTAYNAIDLGSDEETRDSAAALQIDDTRGAHFFQRFSLGYNQLRDAFNSAAVQNPFDVAALVRHGPDRRTYFVSLLDPNHPPDPASIPLDESVVTSTFYPCGCPSVNVTERRAADYQGTWSQTGGALVFGYGYQRQSASIDGLQAARDHNGGFLFEQHSLGRRVYLSAGARYENSSAYGGQFAPRAAASITLAGEHGISSGTLIRVSAGRGVSEPSLLENYVQSPYYHGNPLLKPETTNSYEAGLVEDLFGRRVHTEVNYFRSSFRNLIAFVTDSWQNVEASWARGVEASGQVKPMRGVTISGSYMRLYTRITSSASPASAVTGIGRELLRRPRNSGTISIAAAPRRWSFVAGARFAGERQDADFTFGANRNPGYQNVYASASFDVNRHVTPVLRIDNLLNQRYEEVLGYRALSRSVIGGVRIHW